MEFGESLTPGSKNGTRGETSRTNGRMYQGAWAKGCLKGLGG